MSKFYQCIETRMVRNDVDREDFVVYETKPHMAVRFTIPRSEFYMEGHSLPTSSISWIDELAYASNNARSKIINEVYGDYINELRDVIADLWKNESRDVISQRLNKVIDGMWLS